MNHLDDIALEELERLKAVAQQRIRDAEQEVDIALDEEWQLDQAIKRKKRAMDLGHVPVSRR